MNRVFKVIFNKAIGDYVVCGENTRSRTKKSALKTAALVTSILMTSVCGATENDSNVLLNVGDGATENFSSVETIVDKEIIVGTGGTLNIIGPLTFTSSNAEIGGNTITIHANATVTTDDTITLRSGKLLFNVSDCTNIQSISDKLFNISAWNRELSFCGDLSSPGNLVISSSATTNPSWHEYGLITIDNGNSGSTIKFKDLNNVVFNVNDGNYGVFTKYSSTSHVVNVENVSRFVINGPEALGGVFLYTLNYGSSQFNVNNTKYFSVEVKGNPLTSCSHGAFDINAETVRLVSTSSSAICLESNWVVTDPTRANSKFNINAKDLYIEGSKGIYVSTIDPSGLNKKDITLYAKNISIQAAQDAIRVDRSKQSLVTIGTKDGDVGLIILNGNIDFTKTNEAPNQTFGNKAFLNFVRDDEGNHLQSESTLQLQGDIKTSHDSYVKAYFPDASSWFVGSTSHTDNTDPTSSAGTDLIFKNGAVWTVTADSDAHAVELINGGTIKANSTVRNLQLGSLKISGKDNQIFLDKSTALQIGVNNAEKILFENNAALTTNLDTAYNLVTDDESNAVKGATAKLNITGNNGSLSIIDEFYYTPDGLAALAAAYTAQNIASVDIANAKPYLQEGEQLTLTPGIVLENQSVEAEVAVGANGAATISSGKTGASTITVIDSNTTEPVVANDVTITGDVTLVGNESNPSLVTNSTGDSVQNVTVANGQSLTLGSANQASETQGSLNNLKVDNASVKVVNMVTTIDNLETQGNSVVSIGSNDHRGGIVTKTLNLDTDSVIFLDPAWHDEAHMNVVGNASFLEVTDGGNSTVGGYIVSGRNSIVTFGSTVAKADEAISRANLKWGKEHVTAALYVAHPLTLTTGSIVVDGSRFDHYGTLAPNGSIQLFGNSLLMVDEASVGSTAINGTLEAIAPSEAEVKPAQVAVVHAADGQFTLASEGVSGITDDNLVTDNQFVKASIAENVITTDVDEQKLAGAVASLGIVQLARRADTVFANTIADRTAQTIAGEGVSLWADVGGERYEADDLDNKAQFKSNMFYGAFGADVGITPNARIGAALQYGTGDSKSRNYGIKNDIDAVSLGLYGTYNFNENMKVVGEFAYTMSSNDITASERLLNNDVDADAFSLGVRGQYEFKVGALKITPSVGVRLTRICTDDFNVGAVKVDLDSQTLVQIPLSVAFSADIEQAGWTMKPYSKVSFTPSFGDDEINVRGYKQDALDTMPVQGDFGLSATNGSVTFGASLSAGFGQDGAQNFGGKVGIRYAF